jgi:hypothetical protein
VLTPPQHQKKGVFQYRAFCDSAGLFTPKGIQMRPDKPPSPAREESSALFLQREMRDIINSDPALIEGVTALVAESLLRGWRKRGARTIYIPADTSRTD